MTQAAMEMRNDPSKGRPLTGRKVLAILVGFFLTVGLVNATMIRYALSTFRGEVADHPYEVGLAFNKEIAAGRAQEARQWAVEEHFDSVVHRIQISVRDAKGQPVEGLTWNATFQAPADKKLDRSVGLSLRDGGQYAAPIPVASGMWDVELTASRGEDVLFRSVSRIRIE